MAEQASSDTQGLHEAQERQEPEWKNCAQLLMKKIAKDLMDLCPQEYDGIRIIEKVMNLQKTSYEIPMEVYQRFRDSPNETSTGNCQFALILLKEVEMRQKNCYKEVQLHMDQLKRVDKMIKEYLSSFLNIHKMYEQYYVDKMDEQYVNTKKVFNELQERERVRGDRNDEMRKRVEENGKKMVEMLQQFEQMKKENDSILKLINNDKGDY